MSRTALKVVSDHGGATDCFTEMTAQLSVQRGIFSLVLLEKFLPGTQRFWGKSNKKALKKVKHCNHSGRVR